MNARTIPAVVACVALAFGLAGCGGQADSEPTLADLELEQARWESQERAKYCEGFESVTLGSHETSLGFELAAKGETAESIDLLTAGRNRTEPYDCNEPLFETMLERHLEKSHGESPLGKAGIAHGVR